MTVEKMNKVYRLCKSIGIETVKDLNRFGKETDLQAPTPRTLIAALQTELQLGGVTEQKEREIGR